MKCNNCGADFQTADLKCPYCGTQNIIGEEWQKERNWYKNQYEKILEDVKCNGPMYVANTLLNKALIILLICMIVITLIYLLPSIWHDVSMAGQKAILGTSIKKQLEEYHEAGDWENVRILMDQYEMYGSDNYTYTQAAIMQRNYNEYLRHKMMFMDLSEEEKLEDDYHLKYSIRESMNVYFVNCGIYSDLDPENAAQHKVFQEEIMSYWRNMLGMTEEEINDILENDYISYSEIDELVIKIKERKAWQ